MKSDKKRRLMNKIKVTKSELNLNMNVYKLWTDKLGVNVSMTKFYLPYIHIRYFVDGLTVQGSQECG
jgi:hypothetical protein